MKAFLILINILLAAGTAWSLISLTASSPDADNDEYFIRRTSSAKKKTAAAAVSKKQTSEPETVNDADLVSLVKEQNIFDPSRCPSAQMPGNNRARNNVQLNMTLVGTFKIGNESGAIILQKQQGNNNQQNNMVPPFFRGGMMMMPPGMNGNAADGGDMQPDAGDGQEAGAQPDSGSRRNRGSFRQRFGPGARGFFPGMNTATAEANTGNVVYKQYVRLGETLANGYTLTAVTRTGATLVKNSEKLELELTKSSERKPPAQPARGVRVVNAKPGQQNQNNAAAGTPMQPEQMRQWMEQMRAMRDSSRQSGDGENNNTRGGNRRGGNR